ncbi:MAG: hypothetical protein AAGB15_09425 [Pseudomonadota bacterium]
MYRAILFILSAALVATGPHGTASGHEQLNENGDRLNAVSLINGRVRGSEVLAMGYKQRYYVDPEGRARAAWTNPNTQEIKTTSASNKWFVDGVGGLDRDKPSSEVEGFCREFGPNYLLSNIRMRERKRGDFTSFAVECRQLGDNGTLRQDRRAQSVLLFRRSTEEPVASFSLTPIMLVVGFAVSEPKFATLTESKMIDIQPVFVTAPEAVGGAQAASVGPRLFNRRSNVDVRYFICPIGFVVSGVRIQTRETNKGRAIGRGVDLQCVRMQAEPRPMAEE